MSYLYIYTLHYTLYYIYLYIIKHLVSSSRLFTFEVWIWPRLEGAWIWPHAWSNHLVDLEHRRQRSAILGTESHFCVMTCDYINIWYRYIYICVFYIYICILYYICGIGVWWWWWCNCSSLFLCPSPTCWHQWHIFNFGEVGGDQKQNQQHFGAHTLQISSAKFLSMPTSSSVESVGRASRWCWGHCKVST